MGGQRGRGAGAAVTLLAVLLLQARGLSKAFDGGGAGRRALFSDVSFSVPPGAIVGIIGGNGTG